MGSTRVRTSRRSPNRGSHGYTYEYMRPWDAYWPNGPLPAWQARRGWGRVAIANSDSGAYAYAHSAIDQATWAVNELLDRGLHTWRFSFLVANRMVYTDDFIQDVLGIEILPEALRHYTSIELLP
jgi:hypothetical protein